MSKWERALPPWVPAESHVNLGFFFPHSPGHQMSFLTFVLQGHPREALIFLILHWKHTVVLLSWGVPKAGAWPQGWPSRSRAQWN